MAADIGQTEYGVKSFENQFMKLWVRDGILNCLYVPYLTINIDVARICIEDRLRFINGVTYPMFSDIRKIQYIDREARILFAKESSLKNISAEGLLISSQSEKFLWNLYININKPPIPTKLFGDEKEAIWWLQKHKPL